MKILNGQRKLFLLVWIPIMLIVTIGFTANISQKVWMAILETDGSISWWNGIITIEDILFQVLIMSIISTFLFVIVGIKPKSMSEIIRQKLANVFLLTIWSGMAMSLLIICWSISVF